MPSDEASSGNGGPGGRLRERLRLERPILLDGATGTELEHRGVYTGLPLWSTHALLDSADAVREIHADYARAGAEVITANTFRTQHRVLRVSEATRDDPNADVRLTDLAVRLAREAIDDAGSTAFVAGSAPPLEDCYAPERVADEVALQSEHARHAGNLTAAGVDLILVETMNTIREARAAARAVHALDCPMVVSFVCWDGDCLLSGEPLAEAVSAVAEFAPIAVAVNCLPPSNVERCWATLRASGRPTGVYANLGEPESETGFTRRESCGPEDFALRMAPLIETGARLIGGCCGTTPAHIAALAAELRGWRPATD